MSTLTTGCILPAEGQLTQADLNFPPEYDLRSLSPADSRLDVNPTTCSVFKVEVGRIWDRDDELLLFRWVANNARANTRVLRTETSSFDVGRARPTETRVFPVSDFASEVRLAEEPGGTGVGVLSLFITDAPEWADEAVDNPDQKALDLSRVVDDGSDGGPPAYSVIEVRWSVVISDRLEGCPL